MNTVNETSEPIPRRRIPQEMTPYHPPSMPPPTSTPPRPVPQTAGLQPLGGAPSRPVTGIANLAKGIAAVMRDVGTITKSGHNKFFNYKYVTLDDLLHAVTPLMGLHGIVIIQNEIERHSAENRILVTYEFSIIHTSGEIWPERPRFTGMSGGRDSKGSYDDKAINKCHSAARKYFLLALFQVPSGDYDDADPDPPQNTQQDTQQAAQPPKQASGTYIPVPPTPVPPRPAPPPPVQRAAVPGPADPAIPEKAKPQKIGLGAGKGPEEWATRFIQCLGEATSTQELTEWDALNDTTLQAINERYPDIYNRIYTAQERRMRDLSAPFQAEGIDAETGEVLGEFPVSETSETLTLVVDDPMPDPKVDAQAAINWVAQKLNEFEAYQPAETFWNNFVATREKDFDMLDWEALFKEWQRIEVKFGVTS